MANLVEWVEELTQGETIEGVVIGEMGWGDYGSEDVPNYDKQPKGQVISWEVARPFLDYEFNAGCGAPGCNAICVWTDKSIMFISKYDGATAPEKFPRHPTAFMPEMPGGG